MTKQQVDLNNHINELLQASLKLETQLIKNHKEEIATQVRRVTSELAECMMRVSGLRKALHDFWMERKALSL